MQRRAKREARAQRRAARLQFEGSSLRKAIVLVVALKIAAIVLVFDRAGLDVFDLPKNIVSRLFAWVLVGLLAMALIRHGPGIVPRTPLHAFVVVFALANVISAVFAENTYVALFGERDRYLGLTFIADMLVLYAAVAVAFRAPRDWAAVAVIPGLAGALALGYAVLQYAKLDPIKWQLETYGRPFSTFGHPDMYGHFLSLSFAVALAIAVFAGRRARSTRIAAGAAALAALAGIGIVATRGSALGVAAALAAVPLVAVRLRVIPKGQIVRSIAIGTGALAVAAALVLVSPLGTRLRATALEGYAVADRLVIYENGLSAFADRPLLGWGPDGFAVAYPHYRQARETALHGIDRVHTSAHAWPLQAAATTGIVGLGALLALIAAAVVALWRSGLERLPTVSAALLVGGAAYWAHGLVSPGSIDVDWYAWIVFGGAAAVAGTRTLEERPLARMARAAPWIAATAAIAGAILLYPPFSANQQAQAAQVRLSAGDPAGAIQQAEAAVGSDPGRARYWSILGAARQQRGAWRAAAEAHGESVRRAPYAANLWVNLASARAGQAVTGDDRPNARAAAFDAARRATAVDPNEPVPHETLARVAAEFGDQELAYTEIARAIALFPPEPRFDTVAAQVAGRATDARSALTFLSGLLAYKDSATLRLAMAQAALRSGDREAARVNARRALELEPANADAQALLRSLGG
ncbi:MAG: O-antigen ligase family protein [Chloroflexi bacterium]|nr:O-antigen ligase family protein [Chloroflexota bacterium]